MADGLQARFEEKAADGFIIQGGTPDTFRALPTVVPVLQARGLFRTDYPGTTLRESLGLDEPKISSHNNKREKRYAEIIAYSGACAGLYPPSGQRTSILTAPA